MVNCILDKDETVEDAPEPTNYPYGTVGYLVESLKAFNPNDRLEFAVGYDEIVNVLSIYRVIDYSGSTVFVDLGDE